MLPIAGLLADQVDLLGGSTDLQKTLLMTCAQWGILMDSSLNPCYQELISHISRTAQIDPLGIIRDDALKLVINLHDSLGRLQAERLANLEKILNDLSAKRAANRTQQNQVNGDSAEPTVGGEADNPGGETPDAPHGTDSEQTPLLSPSASGHQPSTLQRLKNWFLGEPVPDHLQHLARAARE